MEERCRVGDVEGGVGGGVRGQGRRGVWRKEEGKYEATEAKVEVAVEAGEGEEGVSGDVEEVWGISGRGEGEFDLWMEFCLKA